MAFSNSQSGSRWPEAVNQWFEANWRLYLITASLVLVATFVGYSHAKAPWNDEVLQLHIERQETLGQVWDTMRGATIQMDPPLLHMLGHILIKTFGDDPLAARAASIFGYLLMCVSFAVLLRRYVPALYAAAGFFMPYATVLRSRVPDARPYGMMIGCSAFALLCWDALNDETLPPARKNLWRAGFVLGLAGMLSTHFFSILFFAGLGLAELVKWYYRRKPDFVMVGLMAIGFIPYLIWLPTLFAARRIYLQNYFFPVKWENFYNFYSFATHTLPLAAVLLFLALALAFVPSLDRPDTAPPSPRLRYLLGACGGFLLVPLAGYLLGLAATGIFVNYYHIIATFGLIAGLPLVLSISTGASRTAGLALFLAIFGHGLFVTARGISGFRRVDTTYPALSEFRKLLKNEPNPNIVIPSPLHFLPLQEANRHDPNDHFVYLYDTQKALAALGSNTADLCLFYTKACTRARIEPFEEWIRSHPSFYIASLGETIGIQEWQFDYLQRNPAARLTWIGTVGTFRVYQVQIDPGGLR